MRYWSCDLRGEAGPGKWAVQLSDEAILLSRYVRNLGQTTFVNGKRFTHTFSTSEGPLTFGANVVIKGRTLHFKDVAISSAKSLQDVYKLGHVEVIAMRAHLANTASQYGFRNMVFHGFRTGGRNPFRDITLRQRLGPRVPQSR